jgi:XTP/dITP diphosphohydrolase
MDLLVATTNPGKVSELNRLLQGVEGFNLLTLNELPQVKDVDLPETGTTFIANAILKAKGYGDLSGMVTLADDSGLSVDALGGRPGVYSKRYGLSDADRIAKLLHELQHVPPNKRTARFTAAVAIYEPKTASLTTFEGSVEGEITFEPLGSNGFGYDPVFFSSDLGKTFAQSQPEEKNLVSHRGRAFSQAIPTLKSLVRQ